MKKILSLMLSLCMLVTFTMPSNAETKYAPDFRGLNDPALLPYLEGTLYEELVGGLNSEEYFVENVSAIYISQEYLDEVAYNSQANVFFGYTLDELNAQFQGERYVFTLGDDNETTVEPWTDYDDTYDRVLRNVAIGTGVILVCVTVSVVTAGAGAPACSMIFAVAAKTAAVNGLSGAAIGGISVGIVKGIQTGDMTEALKAAAVAGSESFKWGAISGAISGGATEAIALKGATLNGLTMNQAAQIQKESKYPLDVIKQFHSVDEYKVFQEAGLKPFIVNGKTALIRSDIDLNRLDEYGKSNLARMQMGKAPLDANGKSFELHHIGQKDNATLAILSQKEHDSPALHGFIKDSEINRKVFDKVTRPEFWKSMAAILAGGI